mgnify:FL=1
MADKKVLHEIQKLVNELIDVINKEIKKKR